MAGCMLHLQGINCVCICAQLICSSGHFTRHSGLLRVDCYLDAIPQNDARPQASLSTVARSVAQLVGVIAELSHQQGRPGTVRVCVNVHVALEVLFQAVHSQAVSTQRFQQHLAGCTHHGRSSTCSEAHPYLRPFICYRCLISDVELHEEL